MKSKKLTIQQIKKYLGTVAEIKTWEGSAGSGPIDGWFSKVDGSYLCFCSDVSHVRWLAELNLTQLQSSSQDGSVCQIGFDPENKRWYGWSHRAACSFGIGSEIKKGNAGYFAANEEDFVQQAIDFWTDETHENVAGLFTENERGEKGVQVTWRTSMNVPNEKARGQICEDFFYLNREGFGRGEWTAESLDDARTMAIDFARSVG